MPASAPFFVFLCHDERGGIQICDCISAYLQHYLEGGKQVGTTKTCVFKYIFSATELEWVRTPKTMTLLKNVSKEVFDGKTDVKKTLLERAARRFADKMAAVLSSLTGLKFKSSVDYSEEVLRAVCTLDE